MEPDSRIAAPIMPLLLCKLAWQTSLLPLLHAVSPGTRESSQVPTCLHERAMPYAER